jgi:hypothetical protein
LPRRFSRKFLTANTPSKNGQKLGLSAGLILTHRIANAKLANMALAGGGRLGQDTATLGFFSTKFVCGEDVQRNGYS